MIILLDIKPDTLLAVLGALRGVVHPDDIKVLAEVTPPEMPPVIKDEDQIQAERIVELIRPRPDDELMRETLQKVLRGHDTFLGQDGEPDHALRNAVGRISKNLSPLYSFQSPITVLARRKKTFFPDGRYKGTEYIPTALGLIVRDLLIAEGAI